VLEVEPLVDVPFVEVVVEVVVVQPLQPLQNHCSQPPLGNVEQ